MSDLGNEHLNLIANYRRMRRQRDALRTALERLVNATGAPLFCVSYREAEDRIEFTEALADARRVLGEVEPPCT